MTARAGRSELSFGRSTTVFGTLTAASVPVAGQPVELEASPYPFGGWRKVAAALTAQDGSYAFPVAPDRNTRYRVDSSAPQAQSGTVEIVVDELLRARLRYLPLGRVRLSVSSRHPPDLRWGGRRACWFVAEGARRRFVLAARTRTAQRGDLTRLGATFPVAAGRFRYIVCFTAPGEGALGPQSVHPRCPHRRFTGRRHLARSRSVSYFAGRGDAPAGFPLARRVASARGFLERRRGRTAFAVLDSQGRLSGLHVHRRFVSASVVKAMLLVAYLDGLGRRHRGLDAGSRSILYPMIHVSDNNAATAVYDRVRDGGLYGLARRARMTDFSVRGFWANAQISAADQARFFFGMDRLIPRHFRGYARGLLSGIAGYQSWGIPAVARPGWRAFFKGGWRGTGLGQLVHQVARLERPHRTFALAVMTDGNPSMGYGITTIQGLTARLLAHRALRASAARSLGPGG